MSTQKPNPKDLLARLQARVNARVPATTPAPTPAVPAPAIRKVQLPVFKATPNVRLPAVDATPPKLVTTQATPAIPRTSESPGIPAYPAGETKAAEANREIAEARAVGHSSRGLTLEEMEAVWAEAAEAEELVVTHETPAATQPAAPLPTPEKLLSTREAMQLAEIPVLKISRSDAARASRAARLLHDDSIQLDASQLAAVEGLRHVTHGCLTGAAGTGKTTTTKAIIDAIQDDLSTIDLNTYGRSPESDGSDPDAPQRLVPSIVMCAFTGRASQMIKKNFPESWHGNIMTIHRMLAYYPEYFDEEDEVTGDLKTKRRFVPGYTISNKMPWQVILIDEASMLSVELWDNIVAAMRPDCRVYMVGDINQLPPVNGRSIYGFAMAAWPSFELTEIHRQKGEHNPIVDNAWRILQGKVPQAAGARVVFSKLETDSVKAQPQVFRTLQYMRDKGLFDPQQDTVITAINGREKIIKKQKRMPLGYQLGQHPLNESLVHMFNADAKRLFVDAGREILHFAIGDKVMVTKNDWTQGITNGMTGTVVAMTEQAGYQGKLSNASGRELSQSEIDRLFEDAAADDTSVSDQRSAIQDEKDKRLRGPSNYSITVDFGDIGEVTFNTISEVGTLQLAYAITCHKSQGGEYRTVVIIVHASHAKMINREWLYTAITRAKENVVFLYSETAMYSGVGKQSIKGKNLAEKVDSFNKLMADEFVVTPTLMPSRSL